MSEEFFKGFQHSTGLSSSESVEQWAGFSRQLSKQEREELESGGFDAGVIEGKLFRNLYPADQFPNGELGTSVFGN